MKTIVAALIGALAGAAIAVGPAPLFALGWGVGAACAAVAAMTPAGARAAAWAAGLDNDEVTP